MSSILRSEISTLTIAELTFFAAGFSAFGDVGKGAPYVRGSATGPMAIQDAAGTWWNLALRIPLNVGWFGAVGDGSTPCDAAFRATLAAAKTVSPPLGIFVPQGRYRLTSPIATNETTSGLSFKGEGADISVLLDEVSGGSIFGLVGSITPLASGFALTLPAAQGSRTLKVASTAPFSVDEYIVIQDPSQPVSDQRGGVSADLGEWVRVRSIVDTTTLELWGATEFAYSTNAKLRPANLVDGFSLSELTVENPNPNTMPPGSRFFSFNYVRDIVFRDVNFIAYDDDAVRLFYCLDMEFTNIQLLGAFNNNLTNPYGINATSGCFYGRISNCFGRQGRHIVTAGAAAAGNIEVGNFHISDCMTVEFSLAAFDTHPGSRGFTYTNCEAYCTGEEAAIGIPGDGYQIRGRRHRLVECKAVGCANGVLLVYTDEAEVIGGDFRSCEVGIEIHQSQRCVLRSPRIYSPSEIGIKLDSDLIMMQDIRVLNAEVFGTPSQAAVVSSAWSYSWQISGLFAPDAPVKTIGVPHDALYGQLIPEPAKSVTIPRWAASGIITLTSGTLYLASTELQKGETVTSIGVVFEGAAAGQVNAWAALYDKNLSLLAQSPTRGASAPPSGVLTEFDLATPVDIAYTGRYYIGLVQQASTPGSVCGGSYRAALSALVPKLSGTSTTGLTDTAPTVAAAISGSGNIPFAMIW